MPCAIVKHELCNGDLDAVLLQRLRWELINSASFLC